MAEETGHSELSTIGNAILEKPELAAGVVGAVQSAVNGHLEDAATNLGESVGSYDGGDG
jgi:hypothetical protein